MGESDVAALAKKFSISISWIVEAGCHDGTDTLELLRNFPNAQIDAFEPDSKSRLKAELKIAESKARNVKVSSFGLSNSNETKYLTYVNFEKGSGTSTISNSGNDAIETVRLDDFKNFPTHSGLLWLDVEGHAVEALQGMSATLKGVDLAKIEIQMHEKNKLRPKDYNLVLERMNVAGLIPVYAPLNPGYFGDIYFIRKSYATFRIRLRSKFIILQMHILHGILYPLLGKPRL
jgi:FkbM family methyltransferase